MRKLPVLLCIFLLVVGLVFANHGVAFSNTDSATPASVEIPAVVQKCLISMDGLEVISTVQDEQSSKTFYLIEGFPKSSDESKEYKQFLIAVDSAEKCQQVVVEGSKSWGVYMPMPLARKLSLDHYRSYIQRVGGVEKFRRLFLNPQADGYHSSDHPVEVTLSPETAWALRQLGIEIPGEFKVLPEPKQ